MQGKASTQRRYLALTLMAICCNALADDVPRVFMTSVKGTGNLSTWPDAHGQTGLQAADEICRTRAAEASIPDAQRYVAFLSDSNTDAYCRVHGAAGRVYVNQCWLSSLPTGAGPWYRMDGLPAIDVSQNAFFVFPDAGYVPRHILFDEFGAELPPYPSNDNLAFSGTMANGVLANPNYTCSDWTSTSGEVDLASAYRGVDWTSTNSWTCDRELRLVCMEKSLNGSPLMRRKSPTARMAFVTSVGGTGNLSTWPDADGNSSAAAADAICRNRALRAALPLWSTYKAWISTALEDAIDRLHNDGPLYRTDGVLIADSYDELTGGVLRAPLQVDEFSQPQPAFVVWTGTLSSGRSSGTTCNSWAEESDTATMGVMNAADTLWTNHRLTGCSNSELHLYCIGDNDSVFLDGVDG